MHRTAVILITAMLLLTVSFYAAADAYTDAGYAVKEACGMQSAEYFMETMTEETEEKIVRSILSPKDEELLARMLWGEDRENPTYMRAAIIWCVYNRMENSGYPVSTIVTQEQFAGYMPSNPVRDWARDIVRDVTVRYVLEQNGFEDVGRVLPKRFIYYGMADEKRIHIFRNKLSADDPNYERWDWSLPSPYGDKP